MMWQVMAQEKKNLASLRVVHVFVITMILRSTWSDKATNLSIEPTSLNLSPLWWTANTESSTRSVSPQSSTFSPQSSTSNLHLSIQSLTSVSQSPPFPPQPFANQNLSSILSASQSGLSTVSDSWSPQLVASTSQSGLSTVSDSLTPQLLVTSTPKPPIPLDPPTDTLLDLPTDNGTVLASTLFSSSADQTLSTSTLKTKPWSTTSVISTSTSPFDFSSTLNNQATLTTSTGSPSPNDVHTVTFNDTGLIADSMSSSGPGPALDRQSTTLRSSSSVLNGSTTSDDKSTQQNVFLTTAASERVLESWTVADHSSPHSSTTSPVAREGVSNLQARIENLLDENNHLHIIIYILAALIALMVIVVLGSLVARRYFPHKPAHKPETNDLNSSAGKHLYFRPRSVIDFLERRLSRSEPNVENGFGPQPASSALSSFRMDCYPPIPEQAIFINKTTPKAVNDRRSQHSVVQMFEEISLDDDTEHCHLQSTGLTTNQSSAR